MDKFTDKLKRDLGIVDNDNGPSEPSFEPSEEVKAQLKEKTELVEPMVTAILESVYGEGVEFVLISLDKSDPKQMRGSCISQVNRNDPKPMVITIGETTKQLLSHLVEGLDREE